MKKLFVSFVIALLLMGGIVFADDTQLSDLKWLQVNNTDTKVATAIPTTVINPAKHRILRVTVGAVQPGGTKGLATETVVCIHDATTTGAATDQVAEGEIESNDADSVSLEYKVPLMLKNGLVIVQGAYTAVLVEYEYKY